MSRVEQIGDCSGVPVTFAGLFDAQNTRVNKNGARVCRTCERVHKRTYAEKVAHHV